MDNRIRQSVCGVCGEPVRPGSATVLAFGASGRVHTVECLTIAQNRVASRPSAQGTSKYPLEA